MIIVTGGIGYIGKHLVYQLIHNDNSDDKQTICIIDDLSAHNGDKHVFDHLKSIWLSDCLKSVNIIFKCIDITDFEKLDKTLSQLPEIERVYHLAGRKSIKESFQKPSLYESVNYSGSKNIFTLGYKYGCRSFVFSSSATVYNGKCPNSGFSENSACDIESISHVYGQSKRKVEIYLENNFIQSKDDCQVIVLRYFNPVSNDKQGLLLENIESGDNLFPQLANSFIHKTPFRLYGTNYSDSPDGSCMRDFIHVIDLANVHIEITKKIDTGFHIFNVGTGKAETVLKIISLFKKKLEDKGKLWNFSIVEPRKGDIAVSFANIDKISKTLGWVPQYDIDNMLNHFIEGRGM